MLSTGRNVYEDLGRHFTLLAFDAADADVTAFESAAGSARVPLTIVQDSFDDERAEYGSRLILVRPDQFVAWCGNHAPHAEEVLAKATGRLSI